MQLHVQPAQLAVCEDSMSVGQWNRIRYSSTMQLARSSMLFLHPAPGPIPLMEPSPPLALVVHVPLKHFLVVAFRFIVHN